MWNHLEHGNQIEEILKNTILLFSFLLFVIFWNLLECLCKCLILIWFYDCSNIKIQGCYISYTLLSKLLFITEKRSFVVPPKKLDLDTFLSWQQTWSATSGFHQKRLLCYSFSVFFAVFQPFPKSAFYFLYFPQKAILTSTMI